MDDSRKSCLLICALLLSICLIVGSAKAVTVRVETNSGASTSATYYTQNGDWATGDAAVSPTGGIEHTTSGSVQMGLVRAGSADDVNKQFSPYTGDFSASASSPPGGGGTTSADSSNPRADIFVVTDLVDPTNSTVGNYTIDGIPGTTYGTIVNAVAAAGGENNGLADWILVDQGTYNGQVVMDDGVTGDFEDNSALTSVWCAQHTTIDAQYVGGDTVMVDDIPGFRMEGFTVTGAVSDGINVATSPDAQIFCNTVTNSGDDGIDVEDSDDVLIRRNTVTGNGVHGIGVEGSAGAVITDNEATLNGEDGIFVLSSDNAQIRRNTVTGNLLGITAIFNPSVHITDNTVTDNTISGILAVGNGSQLRIIAAGEDAGGAAALFDSDASLETAFNAVTESIKDIETSLNPNTQTADNAVPANLSGITGALDIVEGAANTATEGIGGMAAVLDGLSIANSVATGNAEGLTAISNANANVEITGNTVRNNASGILAAANNLDVWAGVGPGLGLVMVTPVAGANTLISGNDVTDNFISGIATVLNPNTEISDNNVTGSLSGIAAALNNLDVVVLVSPGGVLVDVTAAAGSNTVISGNNVTDNVSGILSAFSYNTQITDNNVAYNDSGIAAALNNLDVQITVDGGIDLDLTTSAVSNTMIARNDVTHNNLSGIAALGNPNTQITDNNITDNFFGIYLGGIFLPDPLTGATINNNNIQGNQAFGLFNDTANPNPVDAENNWWGSASGPGGIGPGTGDAVLSSGAPVDFLPWLLSPLP